MATRFPPLDGPLPKKRGGPPHTQKIWPKFCPPPNFGGGPKKVGHTHTLKNYIFWYIDIYLYTGKKINFYKFTRKTFQEVERLKAFCACSDF